MQIYFRKMTPDDASEVEIVEKACFSIPWSRESFWLCGNVGIVW